MAYARRAALLAEELSEWYDIYERRLKHRQEYWVVSDDGLVIRERHEVLRDLVLKLNDVASELAALR